MKGIVLAGLAFACLIGLTMVFLRVYAGRKYFKVLLTAFAAGVAVYVVLYAVLPSDLGVLPSAVLEPHRGIDVANGLLLLALLFHGFWDAVYTTAITGFSGNLMLLLDRPEGRSRDELLRMHGAGEDVDAVLAWRLPNLVAGGYISAVSGAYTLQPKGRVIGGIARRLKIILTGTDAGG